MKNDIEIIEVKKTDNELEVHYEYSTNSYYSISQNNNLENKVFTLKLKPLPELIKKKSSSVLFKDHVENPKVFTANKNNQNVGFLQIGHDTWNNRLRIWDLTIEPKHQRDGIGTQLMNLAIAEAKSCGARAVILETQSCNVPAINFYLKHRFELVGFDLIHYSNNDLKNKEFRMEFGLIL